MAEFYIIDLIRHVCWKPLVHKGFRDYRKSTIKHLRGEKGEADSLAGHFEGNSERWGIAGENRRRWPISARTCWESLSRQIGQGRAVLVRPWGIVVGSEGWGVGQSIWDSGSLAEGVSA